MCNRSAIFATQMITKVGTFAPKKLRRQLPVTTRPLQTHLNLFTWRPHHGNSQEMFKLVHLGTPSPQTPDLFELVHYIALTSVCKRTLGIRLKGLLVEMFAQAENVESVLLFLGKPFSSHLYATAKIISH